MPARIVPTKKDITPIALSVRIGNGHRGTTVIMINHVVFATLQNDFDNLVLGTNNSLRHNNVLVTTSVIKTTPTDESDVQYFLDGAVEPHQDHSHQQFQDINQVVSHFMNYFFI